MDKESFFIEVRQRLAQKYKTTPQIVEYIYKCHNGLGLSLQQMIDRQMEKIKIQKTIISNIKDRGPRLVAWKLLRSKTNGRKKFLLDKFQSSQSAVPLVVDAQNKRKEILQFLESITEKEFQHIIKPVISLEDI